MASPTVRDLEIPLRIVVHRPPPEVRFRLQQGRHELVPPARESAAELAFDLVLRVRGPRDQPPVFLGAAAQGPPARRFVYINSGTSAGQMDSCWSRRAKVPLGAIGWEQVDAVLENPGAVLEARIEGTGRDGGPACATVPLVGGGWRVVAAE